MSLSQAPLQVKSVSSAVASSADECAAEESEDPYAWRYARYLPGWKALCSRLTRFRVGGSLLCNSSPQIVSRSAGTRENEAEPSRCMDTGSIDDDENDLLDINPSHDDCFPSLHSKRAEQEKTVGTNPSNTRCNEHTHAVERDTEACEAALTCDENGENMEWTSSATETAAQRMQHNRGDEDSISLWNLRQSLEGTSITDANVAMGKGENEHEEAELATSLENKMTTKECYDTPTWYRHARGENTAAKRRREYAKRYYGLSESDSVALPDKRNERQGHQYIYFDNSANAKQPVGFTLDSANDRTTLQSCSKARAVTEDRPMDDRSYYQVERQRIIAQEPRHEIPTEESAAGQSAGVDHSPCCSSCSGSTLGREEADEKTENEGLQNDTTSTDSPVSSPSNVTSGSSIRNFTRLFRRSSSKQTVSSQLLYGYSMERDYCVDPKTDRIFKSYLKTDFSCPGGNPVAVPRGGRLPIHSGNYAHLRRQVMRKQYSDSIAEYYGQRMRRWKVKKQRSDSVNCPVDRAVLMRQERIDEEFDHVDINDQLLSPRSHDSGKTDD